MPRKPLFDKSMIKKTAFEIFKKDGIDGITARNIAKYLNASPAPIYKFFESMDQLKNELLAEAKGMFLNYISNKDTKYIFLNIGLGVCRFARDEKEMFKTIFLRDSSGRKNEIIRIFRDVIRKEVEKDDRFINLSEEVRMNLLLDCWFYIHGFSTLIVTDYFETVTDEFIKERLLEAPAILIYKKIDEYK